MSIKIILADDHTMLRQGLSRSFEQEEDITVVGQAQDGYSAIDLVRELLPDIVIMDIGMPGLNGIETTWRIVKDYPGVKIIGLSMHSSDKYVREMFKAGASGYLLKNCSFEELVEAIRAVMAGKTYISPAIGDMIIKEYAGKEGEGKTAFSLLSQREREVLQLLAEGKTTKQIAQKLHISPKTVEAHRLRIMDKLHIDNIAQLTKFAIQEGLTEIET
ncbi:MAG: response regulator transcription factor [Sedimentisphaerales bacterium]|nr:response regulator transcription factor [Sedimentisphaerales bacterium]